MSVNTVISENNSKKENEMSVLTHRINNIVIYSFLITILFIFGCSTTRTYTRIWYEMDPNTPRTQLKENITITVDYIEKSLEKLSEYPMFSVIRKSLPTESDSWGAISNEKDGKLWHDFPGITIFEAVLKNETGHILRMKDSRVYLVVGDNTYPALMRDELIEAGAPEDKNWRIEVKKGVIKNRDLKLINDFSTEILPGMSYKGFLFFDIDPTIAKDGKLNFFDVTTQTDAAGNPIKKTTFEWKIIQKQAVVTRE